MPRSGFITASMFNSCLTKTVGKTVVKQCCRIACERLGVRYLDEQFDLGGLRAIDWGNENEALAIAAYEAHTFTEIHSKQQFHRILGLFVGGTPDGLVDDDGMIEIKCPNSDNHLLNLTQDEQVSDYIYQVQGYLWITGRQWCDFVSFDPRFPEDLQLHVRRIERDEEIIEAVRRRSEEMEDIISEMVEKARPGFRFSANGMSRRPTTLVDR